jgi:hypothetical protein
MLLNDYGGSMDCRGRDQQKQQSRLSFEFLFLFWIFQSYENDFPFP